MDFIEACLHETTLNPHTHIASADGKQHLSELVLLLSSGFHCKENDGTTGAGHLIQTFLSKNKIRSDTFLTE